ncbi:MAG TPA: endonuclease/exonuclease/phosphatase family protein [Casimicrobiaceae bacterium]|nr:endonuclease/exonuclease/phosphatase family protein [Casimicrobiaceae bacterium]
MRRRSGGAAALALALALAGCVTVPDAQRLIVSGDAGSVSVLERPCGAGGAKPHPISEAGALHDPLRLASWNLHKGFDRGWQADLAWIATASDIVLLQEAWLDDDLRGVLGAAGLSWRIAGGFVLNGRDAGVLTAARATPLASCTLQAWEPLLGVPKAALITRFRVDGHAATLAVANLHAINFTLSADGAYREQLDAVRAELATHDGAIVFAGDFNTWSDDRLAAVEAVARDLGLAAVALRPDARARFVERAVDYIFVRGLEVIDAQAVAVASSDHNPVLATLRVR